MNRRRFIPVDLFYRDEQDTRDVQDRWMDGIEPLRVGWRRGTSLTSSHHRRILTLTGILVMYGIEDPGRRTRQAGGWGIMRPA